MKKAKVQKSFEKVFPMDISVASLTKCILVENVLQKKLEDLEWCKLIFFTL